ncbi:serine hydrolase [Dyadobacter sp. CY312]|uniref:serine hydrolase domain-containing protein n=1 Tax=Dyadobacter sp. CY312 TaxID=2907303 RepID=UPI001F189B99|nr:serine hydrolase [Dyadobacter sp. CY312]MCE7043343.1 beta-lactamase family protein [Dyadobacter sp. CY312]
MTVNRREFLQKAGLGALQLGLVSYFANSTVAGVLKTGQLPRSLPELQGVKSSGIIDFIAAVETKKLNLHSLMILRHGKILAEGWWAPYQADLKHTLYSLSKSFTSSAIGFAVNEGKLSVNDKVISFFPDQVPAEISANLGNMKVQDLLTMRTGHAKDSTPALREGTDPNWVKSFLAYPVEHEPGTFFVYNSGATYMLSAIIQKLTGQTLLEYLTPRLFVPLGIEGADWEVDPNGVNTGGWGLRVKTEDIAKFGQLYLRKGVWDGKRLLPEKWIDEATSAHVPTKGTESDWEQGYGYQFWRCRHNAYRGDGAFGQYCIVMPEKDMVVAITSESGDMGAIMNELWKHVLPAVQESSLSEKGAQAQLKQKLSSLALPVPVAKNSAAGVSKINNQKYIFDNNDLKINSVSFNFGSEGCVFKLSDGGGEHTITNGIGKWKTGKTDLSILPLKLVSTPVPGEKETRIAAAGTWVDDNTFEMIWRFTETAHYDTVVCKFDGDNINVRFERSLAIINNVEDTRPELIGKRVG